MTLKHQTRTTNTTKQQPSTRNINAQYFNLKMTFPISDIGAKNELLEN
jgi:hypothetical protein